MVTRGVDAYFENYANVRVTTHNLLGVGRYTGTLKNMVAVFSSLKVRYTGAFVESIYVLVPSRDTLEVVVRCYLFWIFLDGRRCRKNVPSKYLRRRLLLLDRRVRDQR